MIWMIWICASTVLGVLAIVFGRSIRLISEKEEYRKHQDYHIVIKPVDSPDIPEHLYDKVAKLNRDIQVGNVLITRGSYVSVIEYREKSESFIVGAAYSVLGQIGVVEAEVSPSDIKRGI